MKLLVCVVTHGRSDVTLSCAISLLRLQSACDAELHFVTSLEDALNGLWKQDSTGMLVVDASVGFEAGFLHRAAASTHQVVVGSFPTGVNWDLVKARRAGESPAHWGNEYNVRPRAGAQPYQGYLEVESAYIGLAWVAKDAVTRVVQRHPDIVTADGNHAAFASAGVYGGVKQSASERFLSLYGGRVVTDVSSPASQCADMEFGGCVGLRSALR